MSKIVRILILSKLMYKFITIQLKTQQTCSVWIENFILNVYTEI